MGIARVGGFGALLMGLGLGGCGDSQPAIEQHENHRALVGTWAGDCHSSGFLDVSARTFLRFDGMDFVEVHELYESHGCQSRIAAIRFEGNLQVKAEVGTSPVSNQVDYHYNRVFVTAYTEAGKDLLDAADFCGRDEWTVSQRTEVTSRGLEEGCPLREVPGVEYGIAAADRGVLYLSDANLLRGRPTNPTDRPGELDREHPYRPTTHRDLE